MRKFMIIALICQGAAALAQSPFHNQFKSGPHAVGFQLIHLQDTSRLYDSKPRTIPISYWNPTSKATDSLFTFQHYVLANAGLTFNEQTPKQASLIKAFLTQAGKNGASKSDLQRLLKTPALASQNAEKQTGEFPLAITIQGGGRPAYTQFILNEWLASQGYRVASIPDLRSSINRQETTSKSNALALSLDLKLVLNALKETGKVAVIGFSKAGEAILHRQKLDAAFDAMIFLDAQPGVQMVELLALDLSEDSTPTLAFSSNHQGRMDFQTAQNDSTAFLRLGGNLLKIRLMQANHGDLTAAAVLGDLVPKYNRWPVFGDSRLSYKVLCQISGIFLDHYLKNIPGEAEVDNLMKSLPVEFISLHRINRKQ